MAAAHLVVSAFTDRDGRLVPVEETGLTLRGEPRVGFSVVGRR